MGYGFYGYGFYGRYLGICNLSVWNDIKGYILQILPRCKDVSAKLKIKLSYIKLINRLDRLLPVGHRWRGDVAQKGGSNN